RAHKRSKRDWSADVCSSDLTSIIAKSLEIPSISGVEDITSMIFHGDNIIIDGSEGDIILNPTDSDNKLYRIKIKEQNEYKRKISSMIREDTISEDGYKVNLLGNIGRSEEHTSELQSRFDIVCRLLLE